MKSNERSEKFSGELEYGGRVVWVEVSVKLKCHFADSDGNQLVRVSPAEAACVLLEQGGFRQKPKP